MTDKCKSFAFRRNRNRNCIEQSRSTSFNKIQDDASLKAYAWFPLDRINPQRTKVFFVTLRVILKPPPPNLETKETRTMKLCTLIVYYIASITN